MYPYCIENNNKAKEDTFVNLFACLEVITPPH